MTRDASFALPPASQLIAGCVPDNLHLLATHPTHVPYRHHLLKSPLLVRTLGHYDDGSFLVACGIYVALGARKPTRLCQQCQYRACANYTFGHYSRTCVEAEGGDPMRKLNSLERRHVSLKSSCCLLQTRQRQDISDTQRTPVVPLVNGAIRSPGARWVPLLGCARPCGEEAADRERVGG
jgi:hypothetical protein